MPEVEEEQGWFASLFSSEDNSQKEREMARKPAPQYVAPERGENETNLDFGLRTSQAKREYRKAMKEYEANPYQEVAAEAAEVEEEGALQQYGKGLRGDIEETMKDYE